MSSPGGRGPCEQRPSPLGTPGPPPTLRLISPPGSEAHPEAPTPEARVPGSCALGGAGSRCSAPGCISGSSVVMPSLAEKDPEEQQDRSREAYPGEILHRVVWGEGAQVSAGPVTHCVCPGHPPPVRRRGPEPNPTGTLSLFTLAGLTAVLGEGISRARVS